MNRLIFAFLLWPLNVYADEVAPPLPALYQVVNVAEDDVLNIRKMPESGSEMIGTIPYNAPPVEVVAFSFLGKWAMVNDAGQSGWVSLQFLERMPDSAGVSGLPETLKCFGNEPFWALRVDEAGVTISQPDEEQTYPLNSVSPDPEIFNMRETGVRLSWLTEDGRVNANIVPGRCTDGMSDAMYGLHYFDDRGVGMGCCGL